ncbi:hypothetical protein GF362_03020 [Candidatus Dojkabacteria bacterium]|nr:hypothetical protein [Candidatus Dojkabacteria bacterium]
MKKNKFLKLFIVMFLGISLTACLPQQETDDSDSSDTVTPTEDTSFRATPTEEAEEDDDDEINTYTFDKESEEYTEEEEKEEEEEEEMEMEEEDIYESDGSKKDPNYDLREDQANVESISLVLSGTELNITAEGNHPDYCKGIDKYNWHRDGDNFIVDLTIKDLSVENCAQAEKPFSQEINIELGSMNMEEGIYTVEVNGVSDTFQLSDAIN